VSYRVVIVPRAKQQLFEHALWWSEHRSPEQAGSWLTGFEHKLKKLSTNPESFPVARESEEFARKLHELHYGLRSKKTHRAVFEIRDQYVIVHSIRHLAQADLSPDDLR
jgi:plasmid stabilization system protein ParE